MQPAASGIISQPAVRPCFLSSRKADGGLLEFLSKTSWWVAAAPAFGGPGESGPRLWVPMLALSPAVPCLSFVLRILRRSSLYPSNMNRYPLVEFAVLINGCSIVPRALFCLVMSAACSSSCVFLSSCVSFSSTLQKWIRTNQLSFLVSSGNSRLVNWAKLPRFI